MMDELFNVSTKHIKGPTLPHQDEEIKLLRWSVHDFITKRILPALSTTTPVRVLEVGPARVPHGHQPEYFVDIRAEILKMGHSYISLDIIEGADVDIVDDVVRLLEHVDKWSFDLIIALEVLEHVKELWKIPHIFFDALDNKGIFLVSTPFYFIHHDPKPDYWRISQDGYKALFGDWFKMDVEKLCIEAGGDRPLHMRVKGQKK